MKHFKKIFKCFCKKLKNKRKLKYFKKFIMDKENLYFVDENLKV